MSRVAVLIRTHFVDREVLSFAEGLRLGGLFDVYALADETAGPLDFGDLPKVSITREGIAELGLFAGVQKLLWRCGDYGLYVARKALPQYDGFWLIEPDVRLRSERPCDILSRFPGPEEVDFLAGRLRPAEIDWDWTKTMDPVAGPIWRCLFALVRVSARALDLLLDARRALTEERLALRADPIAWPNDEAFVASTLARIGAPIRDLNAFGQVYDEAGFSFWFPLSDRELEASGRDGWIYHPVLNGQRYFLKLCRLAIRHDALDELERVVDRMTGLEWDASEARAHHRAIDFLRTQQAIANAPPALAAE